MLIRKATSKDYKNLMALYADFIETDRFSNLNNDSFLKVVGSDSNYIFVAEADDKLVGFITASSRLVVRYPDPIMQVDEFYVDSRFRERGIGQKLIREVEIIASEINCNRIYIESAYKHELGHKFYEANGYKKSGYYFLKVL